MEGTGASLTEELGTWRHIYDAAAARASSADFKAAMEAVVITASSAPDAVAQPPPLAPLEVAGQPAADAADFITGGRRAAAIQSEQVNATR